MGMVYKHTLTHSHTHTHTAVSPTIIILKQALIYFPVLACVDAPIRLLGHIIGFFYTLVM